MKWSYKIGRFWGIDVYIHSTFYILIAWILFSYWYNTNSWTTAFAGVGFVLLIFLCVLLHEYGHALTARKFNIQTRDITLLPIGGLARLEKMPDDPIEELWVALAGPAVNVLIAAGLGLYLLVTRSFVPLEQLGVAQGSFVERLLIVNVILVVFNLLPAFPMDGGRILRALLATRIDYVQATQTAASIGQGMAILFGFAGLMWNPFLLFIAFFVWIGAAQEANFTLTKRIMAGIPVRDVMMKNVETISPDDPVSRVKSMMLSGSQKQFPVVEEETLVGMLSTPQLMKALNSQSEQQPVKKFMNTSFLKTTSNDLLETMFQKLQESDQDVIPVVDDGKLIGLITPEKIQQYLMMHPRTV